MDTNNPTCTVETYRGGLRCCTHGNFLIDADQPDQWPDQTLTYSLKFRYYFQDYVEEDKSTRTPASHKDLPRIYWQTESFAGEYDIPKGVEDGVDGQTWVVDTTNPNGGYFTYTIKSDFKLLDATDGSAPEELVKNGGGIKFVYAGPHCHAPNCLGMELINLDTNETLCKMTPFYGQGDGKFDEIGFERLPPRVYDAGNSEDDKVLDAAPFVGFHQTLRTICVQNSTHDHFGQMASWQMRGTYEEAPTIE